MTDPIKFASYNDHGVGYHYAAETVFFEEEDAGQGSHPPFPLVAILTARTHKGEVIEVAVGTEQKIDDLIAALQVTKARMSVFRAERTLGSLQRHAKHLEETLL